MSEYPARAVPFQRELMRRRDIGSRPEGLYGDGGKKSGRRWAEKKRSKGGVEKAVVNLGVKPRPTAFGGEKFFILRDG